MAALAGSASRCEAHERRFEVTVEAPPADVEDWSGISGAPVFVDGWIYGVVRAAPAAFRQRLYATPAHLLLADDGFVEAVGVADVDKWTGLLAEIRQLLQNDEAAARAVAERRDPWKRAFKAHGAEELVTVLEQGAVDDVLLAIHEAHGDLLAAELAAPARTLEKVLERIVPVLYDRQLVYSLPGEPDSVWLRVPVVTPTIAEIFMAGLDARAFQFHPVRSLETLPEPVARVPRIPEPGIDYHGDRAFEDFLDHLAAKFLDEGSRRWLQGQPEQRRYGKAARTVDKVLAWKASGGLRHYFLFDSRFARGHGPFLARLRESLPALRLLEATGDDLPGEWTLCLPLREILYRSQDPRRSD